jgi:hypothetical protein
MPVKLGVVSGGVPQRYGAHVNHSVYSRLQGLDYHLDRRLYDNLQTPHFHKLAAVLRIIEKYDWILWIDDDAFFMDFEQDMRRFVCNLSERVFFVACKSPIDPSGGWTFLNSGVFFVRNCASGHRLLQEALCTPKAQVEANWRQDVFGLLAPGEQTHLIHVMHRDNLLHGCVLHHWAQFNARPYHWPEGAPADRYPVVHFAAAGSDRAEAIKAFGAQFGRDETLVPPQLSYLRDALPDPRLSLRAAPRDGG